MWGGRGGGGREDRDGSRGMDDMGADAAEVPIGSVGIRDWHDLILDCPQRSRPVGCRPPSMNPQEGELCRSQFTLLVAGNRGGELSWSLGIAG
jgi:hypothetical protein